MFKVTELSKKDYYRGYLQLLSQLTSVNASSVSYKDFCKRFDELGSMVFVIIDNDKVIACGSIFIEKKFIHQLGSVGHIEDIVVDSNYRKKGLGKMIIDKLTNFAKKQNCYKVILDCSENNIKFYEKCNYVKKGVMMAQYF